MDFGLWSLFENQWIEERYRLVKCIGAGGNGGVFQADHVVEDRILRQVAIKLIPFDESQLDNCMSELRIATSIEHENLIELFDAGRCSLRNVNLLYMVMELASDNLETHKFKRYDENEMVDICLSISNAIAYFHNSSIVYVHRDIKPSNIVLVGRKWKLTDFGLTRRIDNNTETTTNFQGTYSYAAPEVYQGIITPASDIWALGVVMTEMITGQHPFPSNTPIELINKINNIEPFFEKSLPSPFDNIIPLCFCKDRHERITIDHIIQFLQKPECISEYYFYKARQFETGNDASRNYSKAFELYNKAAELGDDKACFRLGVIYQYGHGVTKSYENAVEWYRKAAQKGNSDAQCNLAWLYENGLGVAKDYSIAMKWYLKASESEDPDAQFNIGLLYEKGNGVNQSYKDAKEWYQKAADNGLCDAQCNLACLYENGLGVQRDYSEAKEWYQKAANQGDPDAKEKLKELTEKINMMPNV